MKVSLVLISPFPDKAWSSSKHNKETPVPDLTIDNVANLFAQLLCILESKHVFNQPSLLQFKVYRKTTNHKIKRKTKKTLV